MTWYSRHFSQVWKLDHDMRHLCESAECRLPHLEPGHIATHFANSVDWLRCDVFWLESTAPANLLQAFSSWWLEAWLSPHIVSRML